MLLEMQETVGATVEVMAEETMAVAAVTWEVVIWVAAACNCIVAERAESDR